MMLASFGSPEVPVDGAVVEGRRPLELLVPSSCAGSGDGVTLVPVNPGPPEDPEGITSGPVPLLVAELDGSTISAGLIGPVGPGPVVEGTNPVFGGTGESPSTEVVIVIVSKTTSVAVPSVSAGGIVTVVTTVPKTVVVVVTAMNSLFCGLGRTVGVSTTRVPVPLVPAGGMSTVAGAVPVPGAVTVVKGPVKDPSPGDVRPNSKKMI